MIKRLTTLLTGMLLLGTATAPAVAQESTTNEPSVVYIIPIKEMIERGLLHFVRRGVMEADADGAVAIILDMDTPGGRLDATEEIIEILTSTPATTYTFVNSDAISAGAITAMATDHIYMTPRSRIGDAMPIMMSPLPMGGPQQMPEDLKEKMVSPTVAMIRAAAQLKGHDDKLAEAMVRAEFEYKIGEKMICPEGQLLTLTDQDAAQRVGEGEDERPLLSEGTFDDIPALLEELGLGDSRVVVVKTTTGERVARVIEGFPMSGILMALGLVDVKQGSGVYVTPVRNRSFGDALLLALRRTSATAWDVEEFEQMLLPDVAALAATSATKDDLVAIRKRLDAYLTYHAQHARQWRDAHVDQVPKTALDGLAEHYMALSQAIFDSTHNKVLMLLAQPLSLLHGMRYWEGPEITTEGIIANERRIMGAIVDAIVDGDAQKARKAVEAIQHLPSAAVEAMRVTPVGEMTQITLAPGSDRSSRDQ
jgi:DNA-binding FadR family transcriptional regulator/ATP-dependent protease ClpP protease subunit